MKGKPEPIINIQGSRIVQKQECRIVKVPKQRRAAQMSHVWAAARVTATGKKTPLVKQGTEISSRKEQAKVTSEISKQTCWF